MFEWIYYNVIYPFLSCNHLHTNYTESVVTESKNTSGEKKNVIDCKLNMVKYARESTPTVVVNMLIIESLLFRPKHPPMHE